MTAYETISAVIRVCGNGMPSAGEVVPGDDGQLYEILTIGETRIHGEHDSGHARATVRVIDWESVDEAEISSAQALVGVDA